MENEGFTIGQSTGIDKQNRDWECVVEHGPDQDRNLYYYFTLRAKNNGQSVRLYTDKKGSFLLNNLKQGDEILVRDIYLKSGNWDDFYNAQEKNVEIKVSTIEMADFLEDVDFNTLSEDVRYIFVGQYIYMRDEQKTWEDTRHFIYWSSKQKPQGTVGFIPVPNIQAVKKYSLISVSELENWLKEQLSLGESSPYFQIADLLKNIDWQQYQSQQPYIHVLKHYVQSGCRVDVVLNRFHKVAEEYKKEYLSHRLEQIEKEVNLHREEEESKIRVLQEQESRLQQSLQTLKEKFSPYYAQAKELRELLTSVPPFDSGFYLEEVSPKRTLIVAGEFKKQICLWLRKDNPIETIAGNGGGIVGVINISATQFLDFHAFYQAGLKQILDAARTNPNKKYFLLITNYNITFPNAWGEPIFNVFRHLSGRLPYEKEPYPENLYLIFLPFHEREEDETIGLSFNYENEEWVQKFENKEN